MAVASGGCVQSSTSAGPHSSTDFASGSTLALASTGNRRWPSHVGSMPRPSGASKPAVFVRHDSSSPESQMPVPNGTASFRSIVRVSSARGTFSTSSPAVMSARPVRKATR